LNNQANRKDVLWARELFIMDEGGSKTESEEAIYVADDDHQTGIFKNAAAHARALLVSQSKSCTVSSKLQVPLFQQHKGIMPGTKIAITLTKNKNSYCIMAATGASFKLIIEDLKLRCSYVRPQIELLKLIMDRVERQPVVYEVDRQLLLARLLPAGQQHVSVLNIFERGDLPKFCIFAIQHPASMVGKYHRNNFTFYPLASLQLFLNNRKYFATPLTSEKWCLLQQIYKSVGRDLSGSSLITSENLVLNQLYCVCLTDDKTFGPHYSLKHKADTRVEIDLGESHVDALVLLTYCLYDSHITIDKNRSVTITG
jgi:hypothetical protein